MLATVYEVIENRALCVFLNFVLKKKRSDYLAEAKYQKFVALVKLLKYDIYRKAEDSCRNSVDSLENMLDYSEEPNYLTHMRTLLEAGYDVHSSLENSTRMNFQIAKETLKIICHQTTICYCFLEGTSNGDRKQALIVISANMFIVWVLKHIVYVAILFCAATFLYRLFMVTSNLIASLYALVNEFDFCVRQQIVQNCSDFVFPFQFRFVEF